MKTKHYLTLADVKIIAAACEAEAVRNNWGVVIAITDDGRHLLWLQRMDEARPANSEVAILKAHTAAVNRKPTKVREDLIRGGRNSVLKMPGLPVEGGVPIMYQGECVGAIGVSGVQSEEDTQIANAGTAVLAS